MMVIFPMELLCVLTPSLTQVLGVGLVSLDVSLNKLYDSGITHICDALFVGVKIVTLKLADNQVGMILGIGVRQMDGVRKKICVHLCGAFMSVCAHTF